MDQGIRLEFPTTNQYTDRMKLKNLIQHLEKLNENTQLADFDIVIADPNGYTYKLLDVVPDGDTQSITFAIDEGSCD